MPTIRLNAAWLALLPLLVALALYGRVGEFGFVNYDDNSYVYENPHVAAGLTAETAKWAFEIHGPSMWIPLTWLSHQTMVSLFGMEPGPQHLLNVWLHALNGGLFFLLLLRWTGRAWPALGAALVFAVHPVHVESVAWITERKDVLALFFCLLALHCHERRARGGGLAWWAGMFLCHALAVMAKPLAVTLPCAMLLIDVWPLSRRPAMAWWRLVVEKIPLLAASAVASWLTMLCQWSAGAVGSTEVFPLSGRLMNAVTAYATHLRRLVWPHDLAVFYPYPEGHSVATVAGLTVLLAFATAGCFHLRKSHPSLWIGWLWFFGTLVPMIGLVQAGAAQMADRYAYLPYLGLLFGIAYAVPWEKKSTSVAALAIGLLVLTSHRQIGVWRDSESLFSHAIQNTSRNHLAHNNLGLALAGQGRIDAARHQYHESLRHMPHYAEALNNLATLDGGAGRFAEARQALELAVRIKPGFAAAWHNLGKVRAETDEAEGAIEAFREAIRLAPDFLMPRHDLTGHFLRLGRVPEGLAEAEALTRRHPGFDGGWINLGYAHMQLGDPDAALAAYRRALAVDPASPVALRNLLGILRDRGATDEAARASQYALETARATGDSARLAEILRLLEDQPKPK